MNVSDRPAVRLSPGRIRVTVTHALPSHPPLVQARLSSGEGPRDPSELCLGTKMGQPSPKKEEPVHGGAGCIGPHEGTLFKGLP